VSDIPRSTPVYPIAVVRKLTGLSDRQIRYYEQVGLLQPSRTAGRRRLFSPIEVETLLQIKGDMERGLRTPEIKARLQPKETHEAVVLSSGRSRLPHFNGGRTGSEGEPDVETRRAYMSRGTTGPQLRSDRVHGTPGRRDPRPPNNKE
jgi:DNA-binding transcriptional MerR regulator